MILKLISLSVGFLASAAGAAPFEFKGVKPHDPAQLHADKWIGCGADAKLGTVCGFADASLGGAKAVSLAAFDAQSGLLYTINGKILEADAFDRVLAAFTTKWGTPAVDREIAQNGFGAKFELRTATWTFDDGTFVFREGVSQHSFAYMTSAVLKRAEEENKPKIDF